MGADALTTKRHLLVEMWQPNALWHELGNDEKRAFLTKIAVDANAARASGMEIMGWGALDRAISNPAEHGFCGVFFVNKHEDLHAVDQAIRAAGWYEYFDHTNVATELHGRNGVDAADALCNLLGVF